MRLILLLLLPIVRLAAGDAPWSPPAKDIAAVRAQIERIVKDGYPDTRGATLTSGTATVSVTFDPAKAEPPLPMRLSKSQMTGSGGLMTYSFTIDGLHANLADGSWLLGLRYRLPAVPGIEVKLDGKPMDPAKAFAEARAAQPFDAAKQAGSYLEGVPAEQRAEATVVLDACVPVTKNLHLRPDDVPLAAVVLSRAGCDDAVLLAWTTAEQRARDYWVQRYWDKDAPPFDPTDAYAWAKEAAGKWAMAHETYPIEAPDQALRRAWHRQCRAWLMTPEHGSALDAKAAARAAAAAVDPGDPQGIATRIEAMAAGLEIPAKPAKGAALADRLRSWEAPREPEMRVTGGGASMRTEFITTEPAYQPAREDLDALFALTGDDRPSRFRDFAGPRTVGDNALRAIAQLLQRDPREDVGHGGDRPWSKAERTETATALQAWWREHRADELAKPVIEKKSGE